MAISGWVFSGWNGASRLDKSFSFDLYAATWSAKTVVPGTNRDRTGGGTDIGTSTNRQFVQEGYHGGSTWNTANAIHTESGDSWEARTTTALGRMYVSVSGIGGYLYKWGGEDAAKKANTDRYTYSVNTWTARTAMAEAITEMGDCAEFGALKIWAFFGNAASAKTDSRVHSASGNTWSSKSTQATLTAGAETLAREDGLDTGGIITQGTAVDQLLYNFSGDSYSAKVNLISHHQNGCAFFVNDSLYSVIIGAEAGATQAVHRYDLSADTISASTGQSETQYNSAGAATQGTGVAHISETSTLDPFDTLDPAVVNAHAQSGSTHTAGDGFTAGGGIVAGTTTFYVDYDSITEIHPDSTTFSTSVDTAGVDDDDNDTSTDTTDTTTPVPDQMTLVALQGSDRLDVTVNHLDKYGATIPDSSAFYYVKPYTPQAPVVNNWQPATNEIDINPVPHASENAAVEHAIQLTQGDAADVGRYVTGAGNLSATPTYQTDATWSTIRVTVTSGGSGTLGFKLISRNYYDNSVLSDLGPEGTQSSQTPPTITSFNAVQQASGFVLCSMTVADVNSDGAKIKVEIKKTTGGSYGDFVETVTTPITVDYGSTPDIDNGQVYQVGTVTPIDTGSGNNNVSFRWDAKTDQDGENEGYTIQLTPADATAAGTPVTDTVAVDVLDPVNVSLVAVEGTYLSGIKDITVDAEWTETGPDLNTYGARTNGTGGWTEVAGDNGLADPTSELVTLASNWNGDDVINFRCIHVDDFGNTLTTEDVVSVTPLAPPAVTISNIQKTTTDFTVVEHGGEPAGVLTYAINISGGASGWIQADGSIDAAAVYQLASTWATKTIIGLIPNTYYVLYAVAKNPNGTNPISANGTTSDFTTLVNSPDVQGVTVTPVNDGTKTYTVAYQARDEVYGAYTVTVQYYDAGIWYNISGATGDVGAVNYTETHPTYQNYSISWDASVDADTQEIDPSQFKVTAVNGGGGADFAVSSNFILDTLLPTLGGTLSFTTILQTSADVNWTDQAVDGNFESYEIWVSVTNQAAANARVEDSNTFLWDDNDDASLGTLATLTTNVTGLALFQIYYVALFARDIRGNISTPAIEGNFQTLGSSEISGIVREQNGYPVPNVAVRLYRRDTGALVEGTTSDSVGAWTLVGGYPVNDTDFYLVYYLSPWGAAIIDEIVPVPV